MAPHLWLKDEIARELLEEGEAPDRRRVPEGTTDETAGSEPDFLRDAETDHEVLTGGAQRE